MSKTFVNEKSLTRIVSSSSTFSGVHQTSGSASQRSRAADAAVVSGSSALRLSASIRARGSESLCVRRLWSCAVRMLILNIGLVVDALDVHGPDVVVGAGDEIVDRAHRREHRMIGVVVTVEAVAPDLLQVLDPV